MDNIVWKPQPRQESFMARPEDEALYGGAAGGGKSDALVMEATRQVEIPHYKGLILRKTFPQLTELIEKSQNYYTKAFPGARYNASEHTWRFPSGAKIVFGSMQHSQDKLNYQGKAYDFIGFDELTHFTYDEYIYLISRNRPNGPGTRCYMRASANPGGIGHGWVKNRFITAAPPMTTIWEKRQVRKPNGELFTRWMSRIFVPSSVFDNQKLLDNDPNYLARLASLPDAEKKALLYRDTLDYTFSTMDASNAFSEELKKRGYTGVIQSDNGDEIVIFDSSNIKDASPVTYDDSGNVIPLSERFNQANKDIRYKMPRAPYVDKSMLGGYDFTKSFAEQIKDYQRGIFPPKDTFLLGKTPDVLTKIGLAQLPLTMDRTHVSYALDGSYKGPQDRVNDHMMTDAELAKIPELIADPVAIIQDKQLWQKNAREFSVDVLVDMEINGKKTLVPININSLGHINGERIDSNRVQTVHGNSDTVQRLVNALNEDSDNNVSVYYVNKQKASDFLRHAGNPISRAAQDLDGFVHSVTDSGSPVKMRISSATESIQFMRWFGDWKKSPKDASKVVNRDGTPRIVYHYTNGEFWSFDTERSGSNQGQTHGDGIYLSTSPDEFSYAGKNRMELYADIKNPFEMQLTDEQATYVLEKYAATKHDLDKYNGLYRNHAMGKLTSPTRVFDYLTEYAADNGIKVSDILKDLGYDGVHDGSEWVA